MLKQLKHLTLYSLICGAAVGCTEGEDSAEEAKNTPPQIFLKGSEEITINVNDAFVDPGVIAADLEDGNLTEYVVVSGDDFDTSKAGTYQIIYQVSDSKELSSQIVIRTVHVTASDNGSTDPVEPPPVETAVPAIESFTVVAKTDAGFIDFMVLSDNGSVDLSKAPTNSLNIVAASENEDETGSVHFLLEGPVSIDRSENNPIYTMQVEGENLNLDADGLPAGNYTLSATPYAGPDKTGEQGHTYTVTFTVVEGEAPVVDPDAPTIAAIDLVTTDGASGAFSPEKRLTSGDTINLNDLPTDLFNFIAVPLDESKISSVDFQLAAKGADVYLIDRSENDADYTAANTAENLSISNLATGDYVLTVTPYSDDNKMGVAGTPFVLEFSVIGYTAPTIFAEGDYYPLDVNMVLETDASNAVGVNDTFDSSAAIFSVITPPKNGSLEMDITGMFIYEPSANFTGTDQFVYEIRQGDEVAQATAFIEVSDPNGGQNGGNYTNEGFTEIKPSADSKTIYVSSSSGKDSNNCLSPAAPCQSLNAAFELMREGYPDHVYLKRGDVWREGNLGKAQSGRSAQEPSVVAFYGDSGDRPKIENTSNFINTANYAKKNIQFISLELSAYKLDTSHAEFTGANSDHANLQFLNADQNLLFEDIRFNHVEVIIQDYKGKPRNITLRRNIWTGAYAKTTSTTNQYRPSNMFIAGTSDLLLEENVVDHGGWHATVPTAGANMYNHNLYIQYGNDPDNLVLRNNIITRASSHGVHGRPGGLYENNFFGRNTISLQMGYTGHPLAAGDKATAINNVITEGGSMVKGNKGCEAKWVCTAAVWGLHIDQPGDGEFTIKNNIVHSVASEDAWKSVYSSLAYSGIKRYNNDSRFTYEGNIEDAWPTSSGSYPDPQRTLGDYNQSLGGSNDFDAFMNVVLNRPIQSWDVRYSADAINDYIRAGYGK